MYLTPKAYPKRAFRSVRTATNSALCLAFLILSSVPVHAQRFVKVVNTVEELARANINDVHTNVFVADPNRGGLFVPGTRVSTNRGTAFASTNATRQWNRQFSGPINVKWFGAGMSGGDDTAAMQAAIQFAGAAGGGTIYVPEGTLRHTGLTVTNGITIVGAGSGRNGQGGATRLLYTGSGVALQGPGTEVYSFKAEHIAFYGTDGQGGTGLLMDSFVYATLNDVLFSKWRNAGDTGKGLRMINTHGFCAFNRFTDVSIEDADDALEMDSIDAANSTGYNYFSGLVVFQEKNCLRLLSTEQNGSIYNVFDGIQIQGTGGAGTYLDIAGVGNILQGVIIDQAGAGPVLRFANTNTTDNFVRFLGGFDVAKYQNNQTIGAGNTVEFGGHFVHAPGKGFLAKEFMDEGLEFLLQAPNNRGIELFFGNDGAGSQAWRLAMSASATPTFSLIKGGVGTAQRWQDTEVSTYISASEKIRLTPSGVVFDIGGIGGDAVVGFEVRDPSQFTGNALFIGNVTIDHGSSLYGEDTAGTAEAMLGVSGANNTQILSPTIGGGIQLITRHAAGPINFLPGGITNVWQMRASDGAFVNSAGAPRDIGEVGNFIGRLHAANVRVSSLTANQMVLSDANKDLVSGSFGPTLTNIGGVLDAKYTPGTNVVFVTNSTGVQINTSATLTDTDGYTLLPIVTTTDGTLTDIYTNAIPNNTMVVVYGQVDAIDTTRSHVRHVSFQFLGNNNAGVISVSATSFQSEVWFNDGVQYAVTSTAVGTTMVVTVQNNAGAPNDVKWQMRYRTVTHSF